MSQHGWSVPHREVLVIMILSNAYNIIVRNDDVVASELYVLCCIAICICVYVHICTCVTLSKLFEMFN